MALQWEWNAILDFRSQAHLYLPPTVMPPNPFKLDALDTYVEWLMIMQHYGAPTRLLDSEPITLRRDLFCGDRMQRGGRSRVVFRKRGGLQENERSITAGGPIVDRLRGFSGGRDSDGRKRNRLLYTAMKKFRTAREIASAGPVHFEQPAKRRSAGCDRSRLRGTQFWAHDYSARIEGGVLLPAAPDERDRGRAVSRSRGRVLRDS